MLCHDTLESCNKQHNKIVKKCSDKARNSLRSLKSCEQFAQDPGDAQASKTKSKKTLKRKRKPTSASPKVKIAKFKKPRDYPPLVHGSLAEPRDEATTKVSAKQMKKTKMMQLKM